MSRHSFDPMVAEIVGLNAAVIYQNICFWCEKNAVKGRNIRDGNVWTYNSVKEFCALFPYFTSKQIRTALDKLENSDLLETGNYNEDKRDRTKWYALNRGGRAFALLVQVNLPSRAETIAPEGEPLPDIKPDIKHTPKPPVGADLFSADEIEPAEASKPDEIETGFKEFWEEIWPSHKRKAGKVDCQKIYRAACEGKHSKADKIPPEVLNRAARAYIASLRGNMEFLKGPKPWLNQPGWEPFLEAVATPTMEDLTPRQRKLLQAGQVPPSMIMENGKPNRVACHWLKEFGCEVPA